METNKDMPEFENATRKLLWRMQLLEQCYYKMDSTIEEQSTF